VCVRRLLARSRKYRGYIVHLTRVCVHRQYTDRTTELNNRCHACHAGSYEVTKNRVQCRTTRTALRSLAGGQRTSQALGSRSDHCGTRVPTGSPKARCIVGPHPAGNAPLKLSGLGPIIAGLGFLRGHQKQDALSDHTRRETHLSSSRVSVRLLRDSGRNPTRSPKARCIVGPHPARNAPLKPSGVGPMSRNPRVEPKGGRLLLGTSCLFLSASGGVCHTRPTRSR
jgi:hypothetical protein